MRRVVSECCLFMPFQKAIGGISGYYVASFTPQALALIEANQKNPSWAIPRQLKIVAPLDAKRPLTGERSVNAGPIYDPAQDKMLGGRDQHLQHAGLCRDDFWAAAFGAAAGFGV